MDLKKLYKQTITKHVLSCFGDAWCVLVCDTVTTTIINAIFTKSDLIDYSITAVLSLGAERPDWELPAIYFVDCTKEIAKAINSDFSSKKYTAFEVFSLYEPVGLNRGIKVQVVQLDIRVMEERIFQCRKENLAGLAKILDVRFQVNYLNQMEQVAKGIWDSLEETDGSGLAHLLVMDRTMDLLTPLMYFFTFRSIIDELGTGKHNDDYFKKVRNLHMGEVGKQLQFTVMKLQESINKLDKEHVGVDTLGKMVLEAPKNIELKANVEKYSALLEKCFQKVDEMKEIIEAEQTLATGRDKDGRRVTISLDAFLDSISSPYLSRDDKAGLLFLLKAKGVNFTINESGLLLARGLSDEDIKLQLLRTNMIERTEPRPYKYPISRYEPMIVDIVEKFVARPNEFRTYGTAGATSKSLRRSTMMHSEKQPRKLIVVYIENGLAVEEMAVAYNLSEALGVELLFGSDKVLKRSEFVEEYRKNKALHDVNVEDLARR